MACTECPPLCILFNILLLNAYCWLRSMRLNTMLHTIECATNPSCFANGQNPNLPIPLDVDYVHLSCPQRCKWYDRGMMAASSNSHQLRVRGSRNVFVVVDRSLEQQDQHEPKKKQDEEEEEAKNTSNREREKRKEKEIEDEKYAYKKRNVCIQSASGTSPVAMYASWCTWFPLTTAMAS